MGEDIRAGEGVESEEGEGVVDHTVAKPRRSPSINIHTTRSKKKGFEGSPYWDNIPENAEGEKIEPIEANPDVLMDTSENYRMEREHFGEKLAHVKKAMNKVLSPREFQAIQLLQQGFNYDKIALNMGIKKGSVQILIERARRKLEPYLSQ